MSVLYRATLPHYCCGFEVNEASGVISDAAPIMRWAVGKTLEEYTKWAKSKRGIVCVVNMSMESAELTLFAHNTSQA